jgi:hypothetical protein
MGKIAQEFYCNDCDGFILVKLNINLNRRITVKCPNCGHQHPRSIKDGVIYESATGINGQEIDEIMPTKAAYSKTSILATKSSRDGITPTTQVSPEIMARWVERFGARV